MRLFSSLVVLVAATLTCGRTGRDATAAGRGPSPAPDTVTSAKALGAGSENPTARASVKFRIVNKSEQTKYLDANQIFRCQVEPSQGKRCSFFPESCLPACDTKNRGVDCCVMCEPDLPGTIELAPRQSYTKEWDGEISTRLTGHCAKCECQERQAAPAGTYRVAVRVHEASRCTLPSCTRREDGMVEGAGPIGESREYASSFTVPGAPREVVVEIAEPHAR